ncbi:sugar transporter ST2 [Toxoplasma gondii RUB]|uniref:Hexose transporter 1 n=12 Tax=Toxoplasma gondii TaxID=5811 RepID=V4Z6X5_TOXGV|nr:sugar transporter [Toxoplasma gondii]EPR64465.1 sugar transporter ST2 [Toxoplasma gondii GT1]ESS35934.1 sugar transporter ST2 [Toxoplasma gondii VEG]KFG43203.1 sugar transporter ST2 [Toxoplasma gondii GAB2-2007-GAL-DOM2]KFG50289.1 sugar transporter ST2 [Toxoplasma gondii FOU]KFG64118.1 sugar transporter ST2 [Toxoplasma gondii RUB]KFH11770.1 sugar transporter ST2 [Toxoplasma gondii VAND]KFH16983.1 sugar transporter ST2 [Toxoplasma gondii MAS]
MTQRERSRDAAKIAMVNPFVVADGGAESGPSISMHPDEGNSPPERMVQTAPSGVSPAPVTDSETDDDASRRSVRRSTRDDTEADIWPDGSLPTSDARGRKRRDWFSGLWHSYASAKLDAPAMPDSGLVLEISSSVDPPLSSRPLETGMGSKRIRKWNLSASRKSKTNGEDVTTKTAFTPMIYLVVSFTSLTGLLMGYDLCVVAVVLSEIQRHFNLCGGAFSCMAKSMFVSVLAPGAAVGSVLGGWMSDRVGRKPGLALSDICLLLGSVAMGTGEAFWVMLLGRFLIGMGVGLGFVVYATYTSEVSPPDRRGQIVAFQEVAQCFGCLVAYATAACFGEDTWRYLLGMGGIVAGVQVLGEIFILPETPRFFIQKGHDGRAAASLRKLGITDEAEVARIIEELKADRDSLQDEIGASNAASANTRWRSCLQKFQGKCKNAVNRFRRHHKSLFIAVGCAVAQNMTAANSVIYFTVDIFRLAGVCNPLIPGVGVGVVKFVGVVVCILFVDRWGRRSLLLTGTAGTLICLILMATGFALQGEGTAEAAQAACAAADGTNAGISASAKLLISTLLFYIYFWNMSWAALMFVVASEVLPTRIRGFGMGLTITTFWLLSFVVQSSLEPLFSAVTIPGTFGLFAFLNFLALLFVIFVVPEGKGRSLEDVQRNQVSLKSLSRGPGCPQVGAPQKAKDTEE